jgi:hypothetical protein
MNPQRPIAPRWPGREGARGALPPSSLREFTPRRIFGKMKGAHALPLCRPAGWVSAWKGLSRIGARDAG